MENEENNELLDFELEDQEDEQPEDDNITLSKKDFNKLNRKALAYDANKQTVQKPTQRPQKDTSIPDDKYVRLELKIDGYTDDAIDFLMKNGGKQGLSNEYVKAAVASIQEQNRAENALTSNESTKSDIERKFSESEIGAMSLEELEKAIPKAVK